MQIEIYQPPSAPPSPPEPPRKDRSKLKMSALFVLAFFGTLAFESRHEIAAHFRHIAPASPQAFTTAGQQPPAGLSPPTQQSAANRPPLPVQTSKAADNSPFR